MNAAFIEWAAASDAGNVCPRTFQALSSFLHGATRIAGVTVDIEIPRPIAKFYRVFYFDAREGNVRVWAFICRDSGDVFRSAGWMGRGAGARGNIFDHKHGLGECGAHGPAPRSAARGTRSPYTKRTATHE